MAAGDGEDDPRGRRRRWPAVEEAAGRSLLRPASCTAEAAGNGVGRGCAQEAAGREGPAWARRAGGAGARRRPRGGA